MGIRKIPLFVAVAVIAAVGAFYLVFYKRQLAYITGRDARLLLVAERALVSRAEGAPDARRTRHGARLTIEVTRAGPWPEWREALRYDVDLEDVLEQVPLGLEAFDTLLVADPKGSVIAQIGDPAVARFSLEGLGAPGSALTPNRLWEGNSTTALSINGGQYRMFCRPVRLPYALGAKGATATAPATSEGFIFCGLVSEGRLVQEALSVSPHMVAAIVVLLALTFLTPPFIKLAVLRPCERFRFSDAYSLALCTFLGLLTLSMVAVDVSLLFILRGRGDDSLTRLGGEVAKSLRAELDAVQEQVMAFDRHVAAQGAKAAFCHDVFGAVSGSAPEGCPRLDLRAISYPTLDSVAWLRADGEQAIKWYAGPGQPGTRRRFNVESRDYFRAAREARVWVDDARPPGRYVQAVHTWSSGQTRAVVAMPSSASQRGERPVAVAATASLASVTNPVLPPATGFAVIDADGLILFHSDRRQALTHNLFQENEDDYDLRSAVAARVSDQTTGRYWGRRHRFYTCPVAGTPWSVVAFRNDDLLRAVHVEILEGAAGLALLYAALSFALPSFVIVLTLRRRVAWLWPTEHRGLVYAELCATLLGVALLTTAGLWAARPDEALALSFAAPWATLAALMVCFGLGSRPWPSRWAVPIAGLGSLGLAYWSLVSPQLSGGATLIARSAALGAVMVAVFNLALVRRARSACETALARVTRAHFLVPHLMATLLFWLVYAIVPGVGLMKAITDSELQILARHEQLSYAAAFERRAAAGQGARAGRERPAWVAAWMRARPGVYAGGLFDTVRIGDGPFQAPRFAGPPSGGVVSKWLERMLAHKPLLDRAGAALRHLGMRGLGRAEWAVPDADGGRTEYLGLRLGAGSQFLVLASRWQPFWTTVGPWPALAGVVIVPALLFWIRWSARHIFLAEMETPVSVDLDTVKAGLRANAICLVPSTVEIDRLAAGTWCERVTPGASRAVGDDPATVIVVEGLDLATLPPEDRQGVLPVLEGLVASGSRKLCILSPAHPADFLMSHDGSLPAEGGWRPGEAERWVRLLSTFEVVLLRERRRNGRDGAPVVPADVAAGLLGLPSVPASGSAAFHLLARELAACPHVADLAQQRLPAGSFAPLATDEKVRRLTDLAWPYYWGLWNACTPDDRLTLVQLCEESFINPRRAASVRRLLQKGIVLKDPVPRPMNESFALFVRTIRRAEQIAEWERAPDGFGWSDLKVPLGAMAASCAVVLFVSHRELVDSTLVFVSAVGVSGVPALAKLASAVKTLAQVAGSSSGGGARA